jgi:hypothetical protein
MNIGRVSSVVVAAAAVMWGSSAWAAANSCPASMAGEGTSASPCQITTAQQLQSMNQGLDMNYALMNDIDLQAVQWTPIGLTFASGTFCDGLATSDPFTGQFDGLGHTIANLSVECATQDELGLFSVVRGTVQNINLTNVDIKAGRYSGALVGSLELGVIRNASAVGKVSGRSEIGGLVGDAQPSDGDILITGSFADVSVQGDDAGIGGLVGLINGGVHQATVEASYAMGDVNGNAQVGGLIGLIAGVSIKDSYALGDVIGVDKAVGGLIGFASESSIINAYSIGSVQGVDDVGGLVGFIFGGITVTESFWDVESSGFGAAADDNFGATGKTTSDMTSFATFNAAWNSPTETVIVDGWQAPNNPSWGICESVNEGYPFLLWQFKNNPCVSDPDPVPVIPVPVNNPWALLALVLMMLGLVVGRRRLRGFKHAG